MGNIQLSHNKLWLAAQILVSLLSLMKKVVVTSDLEKNVCLHVFNLRCAFNFG